MNLNQMKSRYNAIQAHLDEIAIFYRAQGQSFLTATNPILKKEWSALLDEKNDLYFRIRIKDADNDELTKLIASYRYHDDHANLKMALDEKESRLKDMSPEELYETACHGEIELMDAIVEIALNS